MYLNQSYRGALVTAVLFIFMVPPASSNQDMEKSTIAGKRIAVLEFMTNNTPEYFSRIVRNIMEVSLFAEGEFQLLEWEQVQKVLANRRDKNGRNPDLSDSVKLGEELGADFLIVGSIDKISGYRITTRAVTVSEKKILTAYSRNFRQADDIDSVVEKMATQMAQDIMRYVQTGNVRRRFYEEYKIKLGINFNYVQPIGSYYSLINGGYGISINCGIEHLFIENLYIGLGSGYQRHSGRLNHEDRLTVLPLTFNIGYTIHLLRRIHLIPILSPGLSFLTLKHGIGYGFYMLDNSERSYAEPSFSAGLSIGVMLFQGFDVLFTANYGIIYETTRIMQFSSFGIGTSYEF